MGLVMKKIKSLSFTLSLSQRTGKLSSGKTVLILYVSFIYGKSRKSTNQERIRDLHFLPAE